MTDTNVFQRDLEVAQIEHTRTLHQSDLLPGIIKQRNVEPNALLVFLGLAANRPDGSTEVKAYFATDTFVLSIWTGSAWKSVTLS